TKLLSSVGEGVARLTLSVAYLVGLAPWDAANRLDALISSGVAYRVSDLAVRGGDLLALGLRGTEVGDALGYLLDLVIDGTVPNDPAALISAIANRKTKK
ncbi:MAG: hypothetical protein II329_01255, partial [Clostridia bacterium]|nr:hypothetical protein [Clostridia bacterium]